MKYLIFNILILFTFLVSCNSNKTIEESELVQLQIIDQNNQTETVSSEDRIQKYKFTNFLNTQPYKKVIRYFSRNSDGHIPQLITSYYPNGQVKQYLEAIDLRASGSYKEWHENGNLKIDANVIGGKADFSAISQREWLFDNISKVYDEKNNLIAEIQYKKGRLNGESKYYHPTNSIKSLIPYTNDKINGSLLEYYPEGSLKKKLQYKFDKQDGVQLSYWKNESPLSIENYNEAKLENGIYYQENGKIISEINNGNGTKFVPINDKEYQLIQCKDGILQGQVQIYNYSGDITGLFHIKNDNKHGREISFYQNKTTPSNDSGSVMQYCIDWIDGKIHGNIKTWYSNGTMESQKQFSSNKKNGPSLYWYEDGTLMSVEEYENDKLISGKYFKKNHTDFVSEVKDGNGIATLYDDKGVLLDKINYQNGKPVVL